MLCGGVWELPCRSITGNFRGTPFTLGDEPHEASNAGRMTMDTAARIFVGIIGPSFDGRRAAANP